MNFNIRHTKPGDYAEICDLGTSNYSDNYYEGEDSFISKIKGCYEGCFVVDLDGIIGYIISFPYVLGKSFPIDSFYEPVEESNCWYIYDVCVSKDFRNKGIAKNLINIILNNKSNVYSLTSIQNSQKFWNKIGFRSFFNLEYCGVEASYMILIK